MIIAGRRASLLLFVGDLIAFAVSLYLTLWLRYGSLPHIESLAPYTVPFALLFALWVLVFYSSGLYSKRFALFPSRLPDALFQTQLANILFAAIFFFLIPSFGITPKTILALYFVVSLALILAWRLVLYPRLSLPRSRERAVLLARGVEADELFKEVNGNPRYEIEFCARDLGQVQTSLIVSDKARIKGTTLGGFAEQKKQIIAFEDLYEEVFDRVSLSQLEQVWFSENVVPEDSVWYRVAKRSIDIVGGVAMGAVTLIVAPCIYLANLFEGPGPLFLRQERFGKDGSRMRVYKFRSMQRDDSVSKDWTHEGENRITKVGAFLRKTSLDEFPQCINILKGEISLIGPRNDILGLGQRLSEALPYYEARYMVKPGITGWAQINQQYEQGHVSPQSIEETKVRLAYDFYYLKHRSLGLDIVIALKTLKRMFFRMSSF